MLPSEPKIFHGREVELSDILKLFKEGNPRIAILGTGGMGKTSLARVVVHHQEVVVKYEKHRFFVACDSATSKVELAGLIGTHLGFKPGTDLMQPIVQHLTMGPPCLLILDNFETVWEPLDSRGDIEEFLSLLSDVEHLGLIITMRGAERPAKVHWTRPFLPSLKPLEQIAAEQTFFDIAEDNHNPDEVKKVLSLTDNMPLAINLIANLVDLEGCSNVLTRWEEDKTALISEGYDKRSNLDLSISLSLSSPRIQSVPHSQELLSLLSILPDGLSDIELVQSRIAIDNILTCKAALLRTALAYYDEHKRLKVLAPIREYMHKTQPTQAYLIQPLLKHFHELLQLYLKYHGTQMFPATLVQNLANIQSILRNRLEQQDHSDLKDSIYCTLHLNIFSELSGRGTIPLFHQLHNVIAHSGDHRLQAHFITDLIGSWRHSPLSNPETVATEALEHFKHFDDPDLKCRLYI
ncbi:P-loop containing nucleoside triphosphate hydrolase protein [Mycena albidolilacea]|uniref:P-loop containing nucleoside triphosphate hydrolase protein n=1 Tax=Mycena albidolilacea TaxID=1033008 RepID=A0AAD6ZMJ6_9AGAR|nr:P-loop containing nucleoside triphosphate hydrolase protein [Mycena albidolilacea]